MDFYNIIRISNIKEFENLSAEEYDQNIERWFYITVLSYFDCFRRLSNKNNKILMNSKRLRTLASVTFITTRGPSS